MNAYRVTQAYLTIDDASDYAVDGLEDHCDFLHVLFPMLTHVAVPRYIGGTKN
jgi:hypothetical protein